MSKILLAASKAPYEICRRILKKHKVIWVQTLEAADHQLQEGDFDLILCTKLFDDSRMFEFLKRAKEHPKSRVIPFLCLRTLSTQIENKRLFDKSIEIACHSLGAAAFLDINRYKDDPEGELLKDIESFLPSNQTRILLADHTEGRALLLRVLSGYKMAEAATFEEAIQLINADTFELIIVGIHFDGSQSIDLIKAIRADQHHDKTHIMMFRMTSTDLAGFLRKSIMDLALIYNLAGYVETDLYPSDSLLRAAIEQALPAKNRLLK